MQDSEIRIAWTTVESRKDAGELAHSLVAKRLAACVQIDGPIHSVYPWKGVVESGEEFRLWIKYPVEMETDVCEFIRKNHPYDVPQWITVEAASVSSEYANWIIQETINRPN